MKGSYLFMSNYFLNIVKNNLFLWQCGKKKKNVSIDHHTPDQIETFGMRTSN